MPRPADLQRLISTPSETLPTLRLRAEFRTGRRITCVKETKESRPELLRSKDEQIHWCSKARVSLEYLIPRSLAYRDREHAARWALVGNFRPAVVRGIIPAIVWRGRCLAGLQRC